MAPPYALLFAGGVGQRLWPLSRRNTPKQFAPLIGTRSSIQLAVDRLKALVPPERIFIGANRRYAEILQQQLPEIPSANFILEPARRDVGAAVALAFFTLQKRGVQGPVIFQWSDSYVQNAEALTGTLGQALSLVDSDRQRLVLVGEKPRFANDNLGWIELTEAKQDKGGVTYHHYASWHYRPARELCEQMFASGRYAWNAGFFVSSVEFMTGAYRSLAPEVTSVIEQIVGQQGTPQQQQALETLYPTVPALHFDEAILMRVPRDRALVLRADLGWSDPGNLYSLKEALQESPTASVTRGDVLEVGTKDALIYNTCDKPVVAVGVEGLIVVELPDVTLVINKENVRNLGKVLEALDKRGRSDLL